MKSSESPPAIILLPEQMRRINDIGALMEQKLPGLPEHHTFLVNTNHPLVKKLIKMNSTPKLVGVKNAEVKDNLQKTIAKHLYDMALISIGGLQPTEIGAFQTRTVDLIGSLLENNF